MELRETKYVGYFAGDDGHIYSVIYNRGANDGTPKMLSENIGTTSKYFQVMVRWDKRKYKRVLVHSLICETYHGSRPPGLVCSHIDGDVKNNTPGNLLWETQKDNLKRKIAHGTDDCGHRNTRAKLREQDVAAIRHRLENGEKHQSIANDYGVNRTVITRIKSGTRYAR